MKVSFALVDKSFEVVSGNLGCLAFSLIDYSREADSDMTGSEWFDLLSSCLADGSTRNISPARTIRATGPESFEVYQTATDTLPLLESQSFDPVAFYYCPYCHVSARYASRERCVSCDAITSPSYKG